MKEEGGRRQECRIASPKRQAFHWNESSSSRSNGIMSDEKHDLLGPPEDNVSRRDFLKGLGGSLAATAVLATSAEDAAKAVGPDVPPATGRRLKGVVRVKLNINGEERMADVEP